MPRAVADHFARQGSSLERYASRLNAAEINSTFYRSHRASTYARWAASTPDDFRFAVKLPRAITHGARLVDATPLVSAFRSEVDALGDKLGPLLVQLPPSLAFDAGVAERFFGGLRDLWPGAVVCEPRHPGWFGEQGEALMARWRIGRVAADPAPHPAAAAPGAWPGIAYWRLHGSPRMYASAYEPARLEALAFAVTASDSIERWCIFDNTARGEAAADALHLKTLVSSTS